MNFSLQMKLFKLSLRQRLRTKAKKKAAIFFPKISQKRSLSQLLILSPLRPLELGLHSPHYSKYHHLPSTRKVLKAPHTAVNY